MKKLLNKQLLLNFTDSGEIGIINYVAGNLLIKLTIELNTLISVESYIYKVFSMKGSPITPSLQHLFWDLFLSFCNQCCLYVIYFLSLCKIYLKG